MALNINELRKITKDVRDDRRRKEKEKIDTTWNERVAESIESTMTVYAKNGSDEACIYIYDRFWELGKVLIHSEEIFLYVLSLVKEHFEGFKIEATDDDLISRRQIIISWAKDIEEDDEQ